jgi:hypothetical protein
VAMTIYTQLLSVALDEARTSNDETCHTSTTEALANVAACRSRLHVDAGAPAQPDWAPGALADQLAYDIALIDLARHFDIDVDLDGFGRSLTERARIEQMLISRGLPLDHGNEFVTVERPRQQWGHR